MSVCLRCDERGDSGGRSLRTKKLYASSKLVASARARSLTYVSGWDLLDKNLRQSMQFPSERETNPQASSFTCRVRMVALEIGIGSYW